MWDHRLWPEQNPATRPNLDTSLPASAVSALVEDDLRKSAVLDRFWHRGVTPEQIQGEMDRMARESHDPRLLREMFAALGNDPLLIAECLARPALTDRLIRQTYAADRSLHEGVLRTAEASLADGSVFSMPGERGGVLEESEYSLADVATEQEVIAPFGGATRPGVGRRVNRRLARSEWALMLDSLESEFGAAHPGELPIGAAGVLQEDQYSFYVRRIDACLPDVSIRLTTRRWVKQPFEEWWATARRQAQPDSTPRSFEFRTPAITAAACANDSWTTTPWSGLTARTGHRAVWTGTEMIVWGGTIGFFYGDLLSGGRYNPATDTWSPLPFEPGVPKARRDFVMAWTGTEVVILAGRSDIEGFGICDGGRYNPQSNTWTPIPCSTFVGFTDETSSVWTGSEVIVWGGLPGAGPPLNTGYRYNPSLDQFSPTGVGPGVPIGRWLHSAVWANGKMIIWGGSSATSFLNDGAAYNPQTDGWTSISNIGAPPARCIHSAVWTGGEMIIWGGRDAVSTLTSGGRYKPAAGSWTATSTGANVAASRLGHSAVWTGSQMIVWGGRDFFGNVITTGGRYTPGTNSWQPMTTVNAPGGGPPVWSGTEMLVWSGNSFAYGARYNPTSNVWTPMGVVANLAPPDYGGRAVWTGVEMINWGYFGGRYIPATNSWAPVSAVASTGPVDGHAAVWTGQEMLAWGGNFGSAGGRYNPVNDTWTPMPAAGAPSGRSGPVGVWTGAEMIVWGGTAFNGSPLNTGGRFNPTTNSWVATSNGANTPIARTYHTGVWTGEEMIVWGGSDILDNAVFYNTGGRYDPQTDTWQPTSIGPGVPSARRFIDAIWTGKEMIVWGGDGQSAFFNDGGKYDPATDTWTQTSTGPSVPNVRYGSAALWTGKEMIVWGGYGSDFPGAPAYTSQSTGGRYDPALDSWTPTSITPGTHLSVLYPNTVWTGAQMIAWGGIFVPRLGSFETVNAGSLYCAGPCTSPSGTPILAPTGEAGSPARMFEWTWPSGAAAFDVVRGDLGLLRSSAGNFTQATQTCLARRLVTAAIADAALPPPGEGFWYLVRADNCTAGTFDDATQTGARDAEIAASANACPAP